MAPIPGFQALIDLTSSVTLVFDPYRLPSTVRPERYDLVLTPHLDRAVFDGVVTIAVDVLEPTTTIVCNAIELEIDGATIDGVPATFSLDESLERLIMTGPEPVGTGAHSIVITYRGTLNDKLRGFYRSTFVDSAGVEQTIGTTQFQATDARRAFPCWDEPAFKAVFSITMCVDPSLAAVSNSPELSRTSEDDRLVIRFADTMVLSTYLVAWVVGPLEISPTVDVDGIELRVVHLPGKSHLIDFALDCAAFGLRHFQRYYGIEYPGDKVDLVALPDFAAGAMENLGCITFRESLLLVDPTHATQPEQAVVADVILHELAHMWFGDLVTMRWWNGIWLNEAFATFMEVAACEAYRPQWRRWDHFSIDRTVAFDADSLHSTRPIEFEVVSPDDANAMFDVLTYQKGGSLLRMLEQYLGEDRFRDGIGRYLRTHSYGNTETSDLWDALEAETGEPVRSVMDSWIWQGGFPVVSASLHGNALRLTQDRFVFDDDTDDRTWSIPLRVSVGGRVESILLAGDSIDVALDTADDVIIVNAGAHGFYRTRYSDALRARLSGAVLATLGAAERYGLVDDAYAEMVAGHLDATAFCDLVRAFDDEDNPATWRRIISGLTWCDRFVDGEAREAIRQFVRAVIGPKLARLGNRAMPGETDLATELRGLLTQAFAVLGADETARGRSRLIFETGDADAEMMAAATVVVAATGSNDDHTRFIERFTTATTPQEQLRYLYALAEFPTAEQMTRTVEFALSDQVRSQNAPFLLGRCLAHRDHGAQVWEAIARNWPDITERFPASSVIRMLEGIKTLTRPHEVAATSSFLAEHPVPAAGKTLEQHLERQRVNARLRQRATASLAERFG